MKRTFLLILIASLLGGFYLSYRRYSAPIENQWKTFTSSQYQFSIDYPSYSQLITKQYSDGAEYYTIFNSGENGQVPLQILLTSQKIPSSEPLKDYIAGKYQIINGYTHSGSSPSQVVQFTAKNVSNHEGYLLIRERKLNAPTNGYELYVRLNENKTLIIDPGEEPQTPAEQELFDQIIATIRFIN